MKIKIALITFLLSLAAVSQAQNRAVSNARVTFVSEQYFDGIEDCSNAYGKITRRGNQAKKLKGEMAYKTAECYRFTNQFREANEWFSKALLLDYQEVESDVYLKNAEMLRMMTEYDKATEQYELYLAIVPDSDLATVGVESCNRSKEFVAEKTKHVIENQIAINTDQFDMAPMFGDRKGNRMYWASARDGVTGKDFDPRSGEAFMDLWASDLDKKGNWTAPYLVKGDGVNTIDNEGTIAFDSRFKKMFFTRCPNMKKENLGCDIWMSEAKGRDEWNEPTKITGLKSHDTVSVGHPCTLDGKYLIFASDRAGGFGGRDLWYTEYDRKAETWSAPVNMGPEINSKGNELFPSFGLNGELIFASDGREGMGGLDIFKAVKVGEENKWQNPINMGSPINSPNNDYALIEVTPRLGYFTSERKSVNGETNPDIFSYVMPPNLFSVKVNVTELVDKSISLEDVRVSIVGSDGSKWEGYTDDRGSVFWDKRPTEDATFGIRYVNEEVSYKINISGDETKYHPVPDGQDITTVGVGYDQDFVVDMVMIPKKPIRLPEVRYALNSWELLVDETINSKDSLLFVLELLEEYPGMKLELSSHTDSRGSNPRNQILSENRARACYKFLVEEKGVDPRRLVPVGDGENVARTVWLKEGVYSVDEPSEKVVSEYETIKLTEAYINKYRRSDKVTFELLHQFNRRTEGDVLQMDLDLTKAEAANEKYLVYKKY